MAVSIPSWTLYYSSGSNRDRCRNQPGCSNLDSAEALGKDVSIGGIVGLGLSDDFPSTVQDVNGIPGSRSFSDSKSPVLGLMIEFEPIRNLFIEFNGLYRPLHLTDESLLSSSGQPMPPKHDRA
jgi:hypothetical protein